MSSTTTSAAALTSFTIQFNRFMPIPIFIFGVIGNILNVIVFTRPSLRKNPCTSYFFSSSIANFNVLIFGLVIRVIMDGFGIDLGSQNLVFCRLRYLILHCSLSLTSWFTVLAGVDRYCISSRDANRRRFSNLKRARLSVALAICISFVVYSHVLGLFEIEQLKTGPYCYARAGAYRVFYDFLFFTTYSFTPPILMIIVGFATLHNIRRARGQIGPIPTTSTTTTPTNITQLRKRDRQLVNMLLVQFTCSVILTFPNAVQKLYATFTQNATKGAYQVAVENLIAQISRMLTHINSSTSFYLYTLSGSGFRRELVEIMIKTMGFIFGMNSHIYRRVRGITAPTSLDQSMTAVQTRTTRKAMKQSETQI